MDISNYTTEDFVLDPSFKKWVMHPNAASNLFWESLLAENPLKYKEAKKARRIILQLNTKIQPNLSEAELSSMWQDLDDRLSNGIELESIEKNKKIIPLHSVSILERAEHRSPSRLNFFNYFNVRVASVLILAIALGALSSWLLSEPLNIEKIEPQVIFVEHKTVPGVKSYLTLSDGSQVILNSGSELKYRKNFEKEKREIFLKGEAFFNVAKDSLRPFIVQSRETTTTALGTSFNVSAYSDETLDISLLSGKVVVNKGAFKEESVVLFPGEALKIDSGKDQLVKSTFNRDMVIGWTKKQILFKKTPLLEAIRVLENWYGVQIQVKNQPIHPILLSGKFKEETLENVLEGLRFSTRFEFEIDKENVRIIF